MGFSNKSTEEKDAKNDKICSANSTGRRIPKIKQLFQHFFFGKPMINRHVTPMSLGVYTAPKGAMSVVIPKNTTFPVTKKKSFTTSCDNQCSALIKVHIGEHLMAKENKKLGEFAVSGIERAPKRVPKINVWFEIDVNGVLKVSAEDKVTGSKNQIIIKNCTS